MILDIIRPYLSQEGWTDLQNSLAFFRTKTQKAANQILKAIGKSEEEAIRSILKPKWPIERNLRVLWTLDGDWDNLFRLRYYYYTPIYFNEDYCNYLSSDSFARYKEHVLARAYENLKEKRYHDAFCGFQVVHEIKPIVEYCVKPLIDDGVSGMYDFRQNKPIDLVGACRATEVCLHTGLYERARYCIDTLKNYLTMPYRTRAWAALRPEFYVPYVEYVDQLWLARQAGDRETKLRHAARAAVAFFRTAVIIFNNDDAQVILGINDASEALNVIAEFDFDPEWARNYLRNDNVGATNYHPVFFKMVELGAWARHPDELNLLSPPEASRIIEKVKEEIENKKIR